MGPWFKMLFEVFKKKCREFNAITIFVKHLQKMLIDLFTMYM